MKLCGMLTVVALVMSGITSYSQELDAEVPGDHFSLEGALELFKKSKSPEDFEKLLNSPDSKVNNLDLNGDGYIDYIRVFDRYEGNVHAFIIQAVVSERESQDIAVIELEKLANGKAVLQIIGDEDIYGVETIIEPTQEVRTYAGTRTSSAVVNVWAWPSVQYVYGPYYSGWYSPWGWELYPVWWHTWRPIAYVHYHPYFVMYRPYYAYCHSRRIVYAHHIYSPYRTTSVVVYNRHHHQIDRYRSSHHDGYVSRYSRDGRGSYSGRDNSPRRNADQLHRDNVSPSRSSSKRDVTNFQDRSATDVTKSSGKTSNYANRVKRESFNNDNYQRRELPQRQVAPARSYSSPTQRKTFSADRNTTPEVNRNSAETKRTFESRTPVSRPAPSPGRSVGSQRRTFESPNVQSNPAPQRNSSFGSGSGQRNVESRQMNRSQSFERPSPAGRPSGNMPSKENRGGQSGPGNRRR